jgi:predicted permease
VSVVLLVSAGLLVRAVWRLQDTDPGFAADGVLTLRTSLPRPRYDSPVRRDAFYSRVVAGVEALPGVERAAFISFLPMRMTGGIWPVLMPGEEEGVRRQGDVASLRFVTPGFFDALDIPILSGRDVGRSDTFDRPFVAVVSASFARRYWPDQDPIGQRFTFAFFERTVVGVVGDIRVRGLERGSEPQAYLPHLQVPEGGLIFYDPRDLAIRATAPAAALVPAVREIIRAADPEQPVSDIMPLAEVVAGQTASRRAQLRVLGALAALALLLAGVGVHGLLAYTVAQRRGEIGVRLALGAQPRGIAAMILREGLGLALAGTVPGLLAAYAAARGMGALLFGVRPADPPTFAIAVGFVLAIAIVGSLLPAMRAVRVTPLAVMRAE